MDIVIVSASKSGRKLTESAIESAREHTENLETIVVVETDMDELPYEGTTTLFWPNKFNYNACLNFGIQMCKSDYIALCNNDVEFCEGWGKITDEMERLHILSASPYSFVNPHPQHYIPLSGSYHGYKIGHELLGWCIVIHREVLEKIGKLNTAVSFWYSDNIYADQLMIAGIKHAIMTDFIVNHRNYSNTLKLKPVEYQHELTSAQKKIYDAERERLFKGNTENLP